MAFGLTAAQVAMVGVGGSLAGSLIGADAAGDAADAQAGAARDTNATNRYIFDKQVELQDPFRQAGLSANNRLMELMGLSVPKATAESLRAELLPKFTTTTRPTDFWRNSIAGKDGERVSVTPTSSIDEAGLAAAIQKRLAEQGSATQSSDFGSLMETFDASRMYDDPGYQFRLAEGQKGVENSAAARGGLLSGAALKAIQKYGQDYASNEFDRAWQRDNATKTNSFNRLQAIVGTGTGATQQVSDAAGQYATRTASVNGDLGNAQAAGIMGQANAWSNGIGQTTNNLMQLIQRPGSSYQDNYMTGYKL